MKRSEMLKLLDQHFEETCYQDYWPDSNDVLKVIEAAGMLPPKVAARVIRGEDYRFGAGCSMRCDCDECNPNFGMTVWEQE